MTRAPSSLRGADADPTNRGGAALVLGILVVALFESWAASRASAPTPTERDWEAIEAALPEDAFPVVGTAWLGPAARRQLSAFAEPDVVGAPDLHGRGRVAVLAIDGDTSWHRRVAADLGVSSLDGHVSTTSTRHGALALHVLDVADAERMTDSLEARRGQLVLETPNLAGARCKTTPRDASCSLGAASVVKVRPGFAEVDHTPRFCTTLEFDMQGTVRLRLPDFSFGTRLVGHVGVHDFNHRLRNEAATTLRVSLPDASEWTSTYTDRQGWAPFQITTTPGPGPLVVDVTVGSSWRFDDLGDVPSARTICLDLRAVTSGDRGSTAALEDTR